MTQELDLELSIIRSSAIGSMAIRLAKRGDDGVSILGISCWKAGEDADVTHTWPFEHAELSSDFRNADPALAARYTSEHSLVTCILQEFGGAAALDAIKGELLEKGCSEEEVERLSGEMLEYYLLK